MPVSAVEKRIALWKKLDELIEVAINSDVAANIFQPRYIRETKTLVVT